MKTIKNILVISVILLAIVSCATQKQVKEIVASSNAALVDVPGLPQADGGAVDEAKLRAAVERIESVIAAHPDQTVLINTLRMRQAMMLTVAKKPKAAEIVWSKVTPPTGQRDKALYKLRKELVWWFGAAEDFKDKDIKTVEDKKYLEKIKEVCNSLPERSNIRDYLETMHAAIGLQIASTLTTVHADAEKRKGQKSAVADKMVEYMERYAGLYDKADKDWIVANWTAIETFPDVPVSVVRARVELRRLMKAYFEVAGKDNQNLEEFEVVTWKPLWVEKQWQVWKIAN